MSDSSGVVKIDLEKADWRGSRDFFDSLTAALEKLDDKDESYDFTWVGKRKAIIEAGAPINKTLRPNVTASKNWDTTENLFIEGDNLDALKLLQESYLGKVKMIYIDPPYNTGRDFVYHDNFKVSTEQYDVDTEYRNDEGNIQFKKNEKSNGRYHSDWLSMMYPRLKLARNLMKDDGVIFISIDDNESANLEKLCNEILGEENHLATLVWEGTGKNDSHYFSIAHDYILVYAKSLQALKIAEPEWRLRKKGIDSIYQKVASLKHEYGENYDQITASLKKWFSSLSKTDDAWRHRHYSNVDSKGIFFAGDISWPGGGGPKYDVLHPTTGKPVRTPSRGWVFSKPEVMRQKIAEGRVQFGIDETKIPTLKRYLSETEGGVAASVIYKDRRNSKQKLVRLMGGDYFETPKDVSVLMDLVEIATGSDDILLDFFSGSGTLAEAIMMRNAGDETRRKWIMVQLPEETDEKGEAYKAGYKTIPDIARERIRRAGDKIASEHPDVKADYGFRTLTIADTNYRDVFKSAGQLQQADLLSAVDNVKEERTDLDLLYGVLIQFALELNYPLNKMEIAGATVYKYGYLGNASGLIACFAKDVPEEAIRAIAALKPLTAVFRDSSFANSQAKVNLSEHFRVLSPDTKVRVI